MATEYENVVPIDGEDENSEYGGKSPRDWQSYWDKQVTSANKRLKEFKRIGGKVNDRFLDTRGSTASSNESGYRDYSLNLFHANITTLQSMLYGSNPQVEVSREHHDPDDDIARVAALMYQRILQADVDPSGENVPTVLKACLQDRLLPGLGIARIRYEVHTTTETVFDEETGEETEVEVFDWEEAPIDYVHWNDFLWSWGRTWAELHWVAFRAYLSREEAAKRFGEAAANTLTYKEQTPDEGDDDSDSGADERSPTQKAEIWEIWCKSEKKVYWYQKGQSEILDIKDDPLQLNGFYPVPKPMVANQTTKLFIPKADFAIAQDLYNHIDEINTRITIITRAIKVVGVYDQSAGTSVGRMLKEGNENDLIPVENWAMFAEAGGLKGKIDWFPVDQVVGVLQTLRSVLSDQMDLLYQVTGMADIMRGKSEQYSGVGQDQLKAQFGSIRVQALQDEFARFASDLEQLRAEVIGRHFEPESIIKQSGAQFLPVPDQPLVTPALELIKSDESRWRVDIRPESIAMVDYAQLKSERTEYLMAISQYIQSAQAMAAKVPGSLPVLLEMMKWGVVGFKGSNYLEGILDRAIDMANKASSEPQQDQGPSPEQLKLKIKEMDLQLEQMKQKGSQQKGMLDLQQTRMKIQGRLAEITADAKGDMTLEQTQAANRMRDLMQELDNDLATIRANMEADLNVESAQAQFDITEAELAHENKMREIRAQRTGRE